MVDQENKADESTENEGAEPQEEVGPDDCETTPGGAELQPGERDAAPEECGFSPMEELQEQFELAAIPMVIDPRDGLARPVDEPVNFAPAFTEDNVVCLADEREFVELWHEELLERGWSYDALSRDYVLTERQVHVGTSKDGVGFTMDVRKRFDAAGAERERFRFEPDLVQVIWGRQFVTREDGTIIPVRARREKCLNYKRQVFANDDEPDPEAPGHRVYFTNCTVRRSVGGAFMSLSNQAIYACDYRDPPDPGTVAQHLDSFDRKRVVDRPDLTFIPLFGLGGEEVRKDGEGK